MMIMITHFIKNFVSHAENVLTCKSSTRKVGHISCISDGVTTWHSTPKVLKMKIITFYSNIEGTILKIESLICSTGCVWLNNGKKKKQTQNKFKQDKTNLLYNSK